MIERKMRSCEKARPLHCSKRSMKYFSAGDKSPENESASNLSPSNVSPSNVSPGNVLPANVPPMRSNSLNDCLPKTTLKATSKVAPHQLTIEEKNHILNVLLKLEDIQDDENQRDRLVREEFCKSLDDLASTISQKVCNSPTPTYTPHKYSCHICTEAINKTRNTVKRERNFLLCWDCKQFTCSTCSVNHYNGPFTDCQYTNKRNVRLCKPCLYRREMSLRSGEWFYGAVGAQEVKNIHRGVIDSLGLPETPETDSKDVVNADLPKWRQKAQKRISQTSLNTFKVMKQKWQVLAKFKAQSTAELKGVNYCSSDDDASKFSEEIQEQYLAFRDSPAACKYAKKTSHDQSSTSSTCSRQWSRESSPERSSSSLGSSLLSSWSVVQAFPSPNFTTPIRRNKSADNLVSTTTSSSVPNSPSSRSKNQVSMELARKMSKRGCVLEKWRNGGGSCSNIVFNAVSNDANNKKSASAVM